MIKLYTNWFSPFARKVGLALDYKELTYQTIDGLHHDKNEELKSVNHRGEVPTLIDDDITVVNSSDIVAYIDQAYPDKPIYPSSPKERVEARALERLFDTQVDAILVICSLWTWTKRDDTPIAGLHAKAQSGLEKAFDILEFSLTDCNSKFMYGEEPSIVEFSLWPHMTAIKPLGFIIDEHKYPCILKWYQEMRKHPLFKQDAKRTMTFIKSMSDQSHETTKIFWRGDRLEWLLANGYHDWLSHYYAKQSKSIWYPLSTSGMFTDQELQQ